MNEQDTATVEPIAVVGMACRYPDADDPAQLWANVLDRRRAFRRLPKERLDLDDYFDRDPTAVDSTYSARAAVLDGWEFDRAKFRVPGAVYRAADPAHWLALETAGRALDDAGLPAGEGIDRDRVTVVVGNTLTGDVTRARNLRLRWPYTRRVLATAMTEAGVPREQQRDTLDRAAELYREPFPAADDEMLAGGLSNTIAGRICNHFDFGGGGYTVDGACASSLLALITACRGLGDGSADFALAGGVDLSLDPFELVGFAKTGALAQDRMRIYDEDSAGFWPGEGCGMLALMRAADARSAGLPVRAEIPGWGVSSDGHGGITRPERRGQLLALCRAYVAAGLDPGDVRLHEGHGTGTAVGDDVELSALARLRESAPEAAALGSIKANIGHTKAAAGAASLIKAVRSVETGVLPPTTGCERPHSSLREAAKVLRVLEQPETWPRGPRVAGVSAMGFGGINTHVVVRATAPEATAPVVVHRPPEPHTEVVALSAEDTAGLRVVLRRMAELAPRLSDAQLHDLACRFGRTAEGTARAALVATSPEELGRRAHSALALLDDLPRARLRSVDGVHVGVDVPGRVTVLFPGQGAPVPSGGGALARHWPQLCSIPGSEEDGAGTAGAQPRIHRASTDALRWLERIGVRPTSAVGHSLGEFAALTWAGCLSTEEAARLVSERGLMMHRDGAADTGMVSVSADEAGARALCEGTDLVVAAFNGPRAHVLAGPLPEVHAAVENATARGIPARVLPVSHAFHSPAVAGCAQAFLPLLGTATIHAPRHRMMSTVTGRALEKTDDVAALLGRQITEPVRFQDAVGRLLEETDLFCEAGPGHTLTTLITENSSVPAVSVDAGGEHDRPLAETAAALFASRAVADLAPVFVGRAARSFDPWRDPVFVSNPCSQAPDVPSGEHEHPEAAMKPVTPSGTVPPNGRNSESTDESGDPAVITRQLLASATELEPELIGPGTRMLADLHLTSLRVTQLVAEIADTAGRQRPTAPSSLTQSTVTELIETVEALPHVGETASEVTPAGLEPWVRCFAEQHRRLPDKEPPVAESGTWPAHVLTGDELSTTAADMFGRRASPLLYAPDPTSEEGVDILLRAANAAFEAGGLVAVAHDSALSGFLRSLRHEHPELGITVLRVPPTSEGLRAARRYAGVEPGCWREYVLTDDGVAEPVESVLDLDHDEPLPLGNDDVLLVTGGGKGIGHECAAALARTTGVRLALLGRSDTDSDEQLAEHLRRLREAGIQHAYERADVTDAAQVRTAVKRLREQLGEITGLLHASGHNEPVGFTQLDAAGVGDHIAPKVIGLRQVLDALEPDKLRALVTFGSVIGTWGLAGESHYALANAAMRVETQRIATTLPACRVLNVDWSVWAGTGMGERLGVLDELSRLDVEAIPITEGVDVFLRLLATRETPVSVSVHGRLGGMANTGHTAEEAIEGRFLERVPVHYPGVELVAESVLGLETDPGLDDHRIDGTVVLPGVMTLEAMAQAASRLAGRPLREGTEIRFERPITLPNTGTRNLRTCVLRRDKSIEAVLRSAETDFRVDHARAVFALTATEQSQEELSCAEPPQRGCGSAPEGTPALEADQLYGLVYFHTGRFRRVQEVVTEGARRCRARVQAKDTTRWFDIEPLLGNPVVNDATVHVLQACIPHRRVLPTSCERMTVSLGDASELWVRAVERHAEGGQYVWDVVACDADDTVLIDWRGLTLTDVGPLPRSTPWPEQLLAVYLERTGIALGVDPQLRVSVQPEAPAGSTVLAESASSSDRARASGLVFTVSGSSSVGCTAESVIVRDTATWRRLLGDDRVLAEQLARPCPESFDVRATRVRVAGECLSRAGLTASTPLVFGGVYDDGLVVFRCGDAVITSAVVSVLGVPEPVAVAILTRKS